MTTTPTPLIARHSARARWGWICGVTAAVVVGTAATAAGSAGASEPGSPAIALPDAIRHQKLAWTPCTADGDQAFECATLTAPLDYAQPAGATLKVAVARYQTSKPGKRRGILTFNPGGPGNPGREMALDMKNELPESVLEQFDLVGFDPRGVGESGAVSCGLTLDDQKWRLPYKPETFAADTARAAAVARKCATTGGPAVRHITTRNTARDMDLLREVLEEPKLNYLGVSYGTYLGAVYLQMFPRSAGRFVLDSAVDPALVWRRKMQTWAEGSKPAFENWTRWTAARDATYGLGGTPDAVSKTFWNLIARADATPIEIEGMEGATFDGDLIRAISRAGVNDVKQQAEWVAALKKAADGKPASALAKPPADPQAEPPAASPLDDEGSDTAVSLLWTIWCNDGSDWPRDPEQYRRDAIRDKVRYPLAGDVMSNITPCAFWSVPRTEPTTVVNNSVPALVVQNQWDSQTPLSSGLGLHRALTGSRLVYVKNGAGHGVYAKSGDPCAYAAVNAYLTTGVLPARDETCVAAVPD